MAREKKSNVDDIIKLRKILDNSSDPNIKALISADETALDSVRKRLSGDTLKPKPHFYQYPRTYESLEPRVTIRPNVTLSPRLLTPLPKHKQSTPLPEFESVSITSSQLNSCSPQDLQQTAKDLYEIEKVDNISIAPFDDSNLPEWQPVEEIQPEELQKNDTKLEINQISENEKTEVLLKTEKLEKIVDWESISSKEEPTETLVQFTAVEPLEIQPKEVLQKQEREAKKIQKIKQKEAKRLKKLEQKKLKKELKTKEREAEHIINQKRDIEQTPEKMEFIPIQQKKITKKLKKTPEDSVEWESYFVEKTVKKQPLNSICTYKEYTLYKKEIGKKRGTKKTIHFFSKEKPDNAHPIGLPAGYQIAVNKKTKIPYLKKKR